MSDGRDKLGRFAKGMVGAHRRHGMSDTRFHNIFLGMTRRVYKETFPAYKDYGGRGIKCEWKSFEEFRDDMYGSYLKHVKKHGESQTTLDRVENDGNYSKANCRWATFKEQARNTRKSKIITFKGKTQTMIEWAEELGITNGLLFSRLKSGWSVERALSSKKYQRYANRKSV